MSEPRRVQATLPAFGTVAIDFHKESAILWDYMGERERRRLHSVPHLGVAASVFTGINHSRLEYALLQCAVIGHIAKLHKNEERLGLAGDVTINGLSVPVSSAEELLKCWALLSNFGHAQYTYGVERALLQFARRDSSFYSWLSRPTRDSDLREWCKTAIDSYDDQRVHFILCLQRFRYEARYDRRKTAFLHYIRNLLLPLEDLFPTNLAQRYKLARLRALYESVRLLSMVTLDSYYSSHPVRLQLGAAVSGLAGLAESEAGADGFDGLLRRTAAWLADELYLHPLAVAAQREYEVQALERLPPRFQKASQSHGLTAHLLQQILNDGLGKPRPNRLRPLVRLTFPTLRQRLLARNDLYSSLVELERELCEPPATYLSIDRNRFSGSVHVDLLYRHEIATPRDIASAVERLRRWLTRAMEADVLQLVRRVLPGNVRTRGDAERVEALRRVHFRRRLDEQSEFFARLFWALINYVLPEGWTGRVSEYLPTRHGRSPIVARVVDSAGVLHDFVTPAIDAQMRAGPPTVTADRLQELAALRYVVQRSNAPLLLVCPEKFIIHDQYGKHHDDWDGVMIEIGDGGVWLTIAEGKNLRHRSANERRAFKQLKETRDLLRRRHRLRYRRKRIPGIGAYIRLSLQ